MKIAAVFALLLTLAALYTDAAPTSVHVTVRYHHKHNTHAPASPRKRFHVTGDKASFDALLSPAVVKELGLDVWRVRRADGGSLVADIAATSEAMAGLAKKAATANKHATNQHEKRLNQPLIRLQVKQDTDIEFPTLENRIEQDRKDVQSCLYATKGFMTPLSHTDKYTDSAFFDCFRPYDQVFEFFDALSAANADILTKLENVSTTYEGRSIHAYRISTTAKETARQLRAQTSTSTSKSTLYTQSLMHAREWQAGASHFFAMAALIDGIKSGDVATLELFEEYDWVFTPIVNIDGYKYSWDVDRYWRANRHSSNGFGGVDLNRNFPPEELWNIDPNDVNPETYPGEAPLSEPETRGIYDFVMKLPSLKGFLDVHAYGGLVLRPFSDQLGEPEEPYGSAMKQLGDAIRDAITPTDQNAAPYISQTGGDLYAAYGCIDDAVFRVFNFTVPALTIEVEGDDFIARQTTIRPIGERINVALRRFAQEATTYRAFIDSLNQ